MFGLTVLTITERSFQTSRLAAFYLLYASADGANSTHDESRTKTPEQQNLSQLTTHRRINVLKAIMI